LSEKAVVFVDGNNWYHGLRRLGFTGLGSFNYAKVSRKIMAPTPSREWVATRYYVGQVQQRGTTSLYAEQRRYMAWLEARDNRISIHYGRLEERSTQNQAAVELRQYLAGMTVKIDSSVYRGLSEIAKRHESSSIIVEKAVDVMLAVDMVVMAMKGDYDVAYILAADGDYTHAAETVKSTGKRVIAAAPQAGAQLAKVVHSYLRLQRPWLVDCFGD
jgi:uncharacterized LabA/DUF88 family protein